MHMVFILVNENKRNRHIRLPLSHACIVTDLTPIVTIDRHVRLTYPPALSQVGGGLSVDEAVEFPSQWFV